MFDRNTKNYKVICPDCNQGRFISYTHKMAIKYNLATEKCKVCGNKGKRISHFKKGFVPHNKGKVGFNLGHSPSFVAFGNNNPSWKGGITSINMKIRNSKEYKIWRNTILKNGNYICSKCGVNNNLEVDHIKPFSLFPKLRLEVSNGRILCKDCHKLTNTYSGKIYSYGISI